MMTTFYYTLTCSLIWISQKTNLINIFFLIIYTSTKEKMASKHSLVSEIIDNLFLSHI